MPLQRIKYALAHLSRKEHIALLARPNWRRLRRTDPNVLVYAFYFHYMIIFLYSYLFEIKKIKGEILLFRCNTYWKRLKYVFQ